MQPVDRIGREADRRVEPERVRRFDDVVVDRFRNADDWHAHREEAVRDGQCSVAANHHERVHVHLVEHVDAARGVIGFRPAGLVVGERVTAIGGAENGSADAEDAGDVPGCEDSPAIWLDQAIEAVLESDRFAVRLRSGLDNSADHGVQPWRIAAAGHHADPLHTWSLVWEHRHPVEYSESVPAALQGRRTALLPPRTAC